MPLLLLTLVVAGGFSVTAEHGNDIRCKCVKVPVSRQ